MAFRNKLACLSLVIGLATSTTSFAETTTVERSTAITLSSLTQSVYEHFSPEQKQLAQQQRINANTEFADSMFADSATVNLEHFNDVIGSSDGFQEWEGSVDLPLWLPGEKQQQSALSDTLSAEFPAYQQRLLLDASKQVRNVIWNVVSAETKVSQTFNAWHAAQDLEDNVASRVAAGDLASTETLLANSHALEMQSRYLEAKSELDFSLANYHNHTGQTILPSKFEENLSPQTTINQQHPYLEFLNQKITTLRAEQDLAHFDGAPHTNLSVGVRRERGGHDEDFNHSIGVGINFAFDDAIYRKSNIANAASNLADADIERQQLERKLQTILLSKRHQLAAKQQQLELVIAQEKTANQYLLLQQRAFDLGEIDLASLLRSQVLASDALNRKTSLQITIQHAIAEVNQALGIVL